MIDALMTSSALALIAGLLAIATAAACRRTRRLQPDEPPGLLAELVGRQSPEVRTLGRPGILVEARTAIERCRACPHVAACQAWVQENRTDACPRFCPNAGFLGRLQAAA